MHFGEYFKSRRKNLGLTLRQYCSNSGQDPAYISRLENAITAAPASTEKLRALAVSLHLQQDTEEWVQFFDLAAISRREVPQDIDINSPEALSLLPAFYRTLRNDPISNEEASRLLKLIKGNNIDDLTK